MTDAQIFQLIGIIYIAVGIGIITSRNFYNKMTAGFLESTPAYYIGSLMAVVAGFLLVTFHNIWVMNWTVIITIIGWAALIKGIMLLTVPGFMINISRKFIDRPNTMTIWAIVAIVLGTVCCLLGFFYLNRPAI